MGSRDMGRPPKNADEYPEQGLAAELVKLGGFTQQELADRLYVSRAMVAHYLAGRKVMSRSVEAHAVALLAQLKAADQ